MRKMLAAVAAGLLVFGAGQACAASKSGMTAQDVVGALQDAGLRAKVGKEGDSSYVTATAEGLDFHVALMACEGEHCEAAGFVLFTGEDKACTLQRMNTWNKDHGFVSAYYDGKEGCVFEYEVTVNDAEDLQAPLGVWLETLADIKKEMGW